MQGRNSCLWATAPDNDSKEGKDSNNEKQKKPPTSKAFEPPVVIPEGYYLFQPPCITFLVLTSFLRFIDFLRRFRDIAPSRLARASAHVGSVSTRLCPGPHPKGKYQSTQVEHLTRALLGTDVGFGECASSKRFGCARLRLQIQTKTLLRDIRKRGPISRGRIARAGHWTLRMAGDGARRRRPNDL